MEVSKVKTRHGAPPQEVKHITRYTHYNLYVRHPYFTPVVENVLKIRKSLAEHENDILGETGVFFQRVFIFARNISSKLGAFIVDVDTLKRNFEEGEEEEEEEIQEEEEIATDEEVELENWNLETWGIEYEQKKKKKKKFKRKELKSHGLTILLQEKFDEIAEESRKINITHSEITGLFLRMGEELNLLIIEGSEDIVGIFLNNMLSVVKEYWAEMRVFLLDDFVLQPYFMKMNVLETVAISANEKFPDETIEERETMTTHHFYIKNRLQKLCTFLAAKYAPREPCNSSASSSCDDSSSVILDEDLKSFLPEVQYIDLVLKCGRFYQSLDQFSKMYGVIPYQKDEDAFNWPLPSDYTPVGIFRYFEYDVNLTFGDYLKAEAEINEAKEAKEARPSESLSQ